ncbi:MAG: 4-hydroxybenzoate octaprenyltransferase [Pseudomonadota bacterium]
MNETGAKVADAIQGSWVYQLLPEQYWPYAQMARWERPIGWRLLMWPCWWSLMLALTVQLQAGGPQTDYGLLVPFGQILFFLLLFTVGAIVMRGAGCTFNDLVDQNIDAKISRTRSRPLPSGRISRRQAWVFLIAQSLCGLLILVQFNPFTIMLGCLSLALVLIYPFMKRITWWPQLFLGLAFSWGALMGWAAIWANLDWPPIVLYIGCIFWVIGYDTIYALQDIEDDALIGVKSTARLFGPKAKMAVALLYLAAIILFGLSLWLANLPWPGWAGLGFAASHMVWQLRTLQIDDPELCLKLFKSNSHFGWIFFAGLTLSAILAG